jgi:hypothetical protein
MTAAISAPLCAATDQSGLIRAQADQPPLSAHSAIYEVLRRGSKIGEVHVTLSKDDHGLWRYHTETVATATLAKLLRVSAEESAQFIWRDHHVLPLTYRQVARAPTRTRFWQHELDWQAGQASSHNHEGELEIPLEEGLLDPLTLRLQVAVALQDPANRGQVLRFRVLERDEVEDQFFYFLDQSRVTVPAGCFEAIHMHRFRREGSSRNYESWHTERFAWLPLRILQLKDGEPALDIQLLSTSMDLGSGDC